ncbi:MAG: SDR family oxidoreductase, partial [Cyanobacteriota bacterium]
ISTAYVCGDRTERILESELETGQASSNAYEKSKIEAELLVRNASLPNPPTILRPSIVVGDFLDGFTSSFHGFYVPLKFIQAFASSFAKTALDPRDILNSFNLDGNSHKNFVSVDWVSAAISRIMLDTSLHGKTYHLTSDKPTPLERVSTVFAEMLPGMINNQPKALMPNELETISLQSLADKFLEAMEPYKSYWRDDPKFDKSNTDYAIPGFNAPVLDAPALRRLTKFALDHNFRPIDSMTRQPI